MTPIEQLVAALLTAGWEAGDVLVPEQCAEMWNPVAQRWVHITATPI